MGTGSMPGFESTGIVADLSIYEKGFNIIGSGSNVDFFFFGTDAANYDNVLYRRSDIDFCKKIIDKFSKI
jgi:hypothetical protein